MCSHHHPPTNPSKSEPYRTPHFRLELHPAVGCGDAAAVGEWDGAELGHLGDHQRVPESVDEGRLSGGASAGDAAELPIGTSGGHVPRDAQRRRDGAEGARGGLCRSAGMHGGRLRRVLSGFVACFCKARARR